MSDVERRPLVAHVIHHLVIGGLENGLINLINTLPGDRYRHVVVCMTDYSEFRERIRRPDVEVHAMRKQPGHDPAVLLRLLRLFRRLRPTIVHSRNLTALESQLPAALLGVPVRIHGEHGWDVNDPEGKRRRYRLLRRAFRPLVHHYVALSQHLVDYLRSGVGIRPERIAHIYNGVDTSRFRPALNGRTPIEGSPFNDPGLFLIGWVGRMQPVKDPASLARAFVRAVAQDPSARRRLRLVLVGDGPRRQEVESILEEGRVSELAWLTGPRSDVPDVMRGLDCFALPSLAEGISNTILEAMATGLPIVATRVGGNAELIEDGLSGRLVPPADSDALARGLLAYFADPVAARRHGKAGRYRAERRFGLDRMVAEYAQLYERLLAHNGAVARVDVA